MITIKTQSKIELIQLAISSQFLINNKKGEEYGK